MGAITVLSLLKYSLFREKFITSHCYLLLLESNYNSSTIISNPEIQYYLFENTKSIN